MYSIVFRIIFAFQTAVSKYEATKQKRKFSSFFKSLVIELDKDLYGPDNHLVEVRYIQFLPLLLSHICICFAFLRSDFFPLILIFKVTSNIFSLIHFDD